MDSEKERMRALACRASREWIEAVNEIARRRYPTVGDMVREVVETALGKDQIDAVMSLLAERGDQLHQMVNEPGGHGAS